MFFAVADLRRSHRSHFEQVAAACLHVDHPQPHPDQYAHDEGWDRHGRHLGKKRDTRNQPGDGMNMLGGIQQADEVMQLIPGPSLDGGHAGPGKSCGDAKPCRDFEKQPCDQKQERRDK